LPKRAILLAKEPSCVAERDRSVGALIDGTIFTRPHREKHYTAIFVGGGKWPCPASRLSFAEVYEMKPGRRKILKTVGSSAALVVASRATLAQEPRTPSQPAGETHGKAQEPNMATNQGASGAYSNSAITMQPPQAVPASQQERVLAAKIARAMLSGPHQITKDDIRPDL
jgi:hypothetical protein